METSSKAVLSTLEVAFEAGAACQGLWPCRHCLAAHTGEPIGKDKGVGGESLDGK